MTTRTYPHTPGVEPAIDRPSRRRRRGVLAILLGLTTISLGAGLFSLAIFTDSAASTGTFASGTVDITSSPTVAFTVANMVPGDQSTQAMTIGNAGTATLRYALSTVATNTLGTALTLEVRTQGTNCATFDGTVVAAAAPLNGAGFGNPAQGAQSGDRTLAAVANEVLCFRVSLPIATGNSLQGASSAVTFTFAAEQIASNP